MNNSSNIAKTIEEISKNKIIIKNGKLFKMFTTITFKTKLMLCLLQSNSLLISLFSKIMETYLHLISNSLLILKNSPQIFLNKLLSQVMIIIILFKIKI